MEKGKVLILVNHNIVIYNFRKELVERLIDEGYQVYLSCPDGDRIGKLQEMGVYFIDTEVDRHGMNPKREVRLLKSYIEMIKKIHTNIILTYTIKPNIYGGIAATILGIPYITNITGLGIAIENGGVKEKILLSLYKVALKKAKMIYFQNRCNKDYFIEKGIVKDNFKILNGSGVNLEENCYEEYPKEDRYLIFLVIGRLMKDKGTDEILQAAKIIHEKYDNITIRLLGFYDDDYEQKITNAQEQGYIEYCGQQSDVHQFIKRSHATIHASYHEGMSNVLLETAAAGRPVIASDIPGCKETFDDGISGIAIEPRNVLSLVEGITKFIELPYDQKRQMGINGRKKMEQMFDRNKIVDEYMSIIKELT